jgi:predicted secreted Zn-dependent protease
MAGRAKAKSRVGQGERVGLQASLLAHPQTRFLPLPVFVLIALWGCAGLPPTPQREWVTIKTSSSVQYYSVRGATTDAIFDDIKKNGLFDNKGRPAVGVTSGEWGIDWKRIETTRPAVCSAESMTILLNLVVTLPQHDQLNDLSRGIRTNWQRFAASVAAHEQRHVDIYLNGAKTMKTRMDAIRTKSSSCSELENVIDSVWAISKRGRRAQGEVSPRSWAGFGNDSGRWDRRRYHKARLAAIRSAFGTSGPLTQSGGCTNAAQQDRRCRAGMAKSGATPKCELASRVGSRPSVTSTRR